MDVRSVLSPLTGDVIDDFQDILRRPILCATSNDHSAKFRE